MAADAPEPRHEHASAQARLVVAIMAGGSGTRFWPASRQARPKQLLRLLDDDTLLAATAARLSPWCPPERMLVVTAEALVDNVRQALPALPSAHTIGEPVARNTAPCLMTAALAARALDPSAIVALLPADHHVADATAFGGALLRAAAAVEHGGIATLGVMPTHPETGYGYIERGEPCGDGVWRVRRFVEKPDAERAAAFLLGGLHLWNAGIFVGTADALVAAADAALPALGAAFAPLRGTAAPALGTPAYAAALAEAYAAAPAISIDHGIMEHRDDLRVVPLEAGWSDVGTWRSLLDLRPVGDANFVRGDVLALDCAGCVVVSDGPLVATLGLHDVTVVATSDAVLVLPTDASQRVREVVAALQMGGRRSLL